MIKFAKLIFPKVLEDTLSLSLPLPSCTSIFYACNSGYQCCIWYLSSLLSNFNCIVGCSELFGNCGNSWISNWPKTWPSLSPFSLRSLQGYYLFNQLLRVCYKIELLFYTNNGFYFIEVVLCFSPTSIISNIFQTIF